MRRQAQRRLAAKHPMLDFILLSLLPRQDNRSPAGLVEIHRAPAEALEVALAEFLAIDQREGETVGEDRSHLLHQVQRQRGSPRSQRVQVSDLRIEPDPFQRGGAFRAKQRVEKREDRVHRIARRSARALRDAERSARVTANHGRKRREVDPRRITLVAPQHVEIISRRHPVQDVQMQSRRLGQHVLIVDGLRVARSPQQDRAAVPDFSGHH